MKVHSLKRLNRAVKFLGVTSLLFSLILMGFFGKAAFSQISSQASQGSKQQAKAEALEIVGFRILYVYEYRATGMGIYERVVMLFNDGTFTRDFDTLLASESIDTSRQQNPRKWGVWRTDPEKGFMYMHSYQNEWRGDTAVASQSVPDGHLLEGCYNARSTTGATRSYRRFCFDENGLFVTGRSSEVIRGLYQIQGNHIGLLYEDGTLVPNFFGSYSSGRIITLNGTVYNQEN